MIFYNYILFILFSFFISAKSETEIDKLSKALSDDLYSLRDKVQPDKENKVDVKMYYESRAFNSMLFYIETFSPVIQQLSQYLNLYTYPYGNAKTIEHDGHITFECENGPAECYGNKLHACAIDNLKNITKAVMFNACMMNSTIDRGSNDLAADRCALAMSLDSKPIKECAKGDKGTQLLKHYGEESKNIHLEDSIPYILINGERNYCIAFMLNICVALNPRPPPCKKFIYNLF